MKNPPEPVPEGGGGGTLESKLTWALNIAAFVHIFVSPYTKVNILLFLSKELKHGPLFCYIGILCMDLG